MKLPETQGWQKDDENANATDSKAEGVVQRDSAAVRINRLKMIGWYHFAFLLFFSGVSQFDAKCRS